MRGENVSDVNLPFRDQLNDAGFGDKNKLKTFSNDPEKIVRIDENLEGASLKILRREANIGKTLLEKLRDTYNVQMPVFQFLIGHDEEKNPRIYTVTERVHGQDWDRLLNEYNIKSNPDTKNSLLITEADQLYSSLARYLSDTYQQRGKWLRDPFFDHQYIYGRRRGDTEDHLYLIDLDFHYGDMSVKGKGKGVEYNLFFEYIINFADMIRGTETYMTETLLLPDRNFLH